MLIRPVETPLDLSRILSLQKKNITAAISLEEMSSQGFVTVEHSLAQLEKMQALTPQIIAVKEQELVGYALVMPRALKNIIPVLVPMFDLLDTLSYKGQAVKDLSYYVMGQVCVAKEYRGQEQYNYCITEVSTRNLRSMQAHFAIGFELLHRFTDAQDEWNIVLWDWTK